MSGHWILRHGGPSSGFRYTTDAGRAVRDARTLARIESMHIPPAWRDVHIAASARAMLQAWGVDARGRKQYRYHERAVEVREARKYHRVRRLARDLPRIRSSLHRDMLRAESERDRVAAAVVRLISKGFFRVGSERYVRENHTYGLVTLRKTHVRVERDVIHFTYRGKGRKDQHHVVVDPALAQFVRRLLRTPGRRLFRYRTAEGEWSDLTRREVNEYIQRRMSAHYTAKDFRTWGGTVRVATVLADLGPAASANEAKKNVVLAVRLTAAELGNTPAICRASYVHPIVLARYLDEGETIALPTMANGRTASGHYPEERALIQFLDRYFPERRRRPRLEALAAA